MLEYTALLIFNIKSAVNLTLIFAFEINLFFPNIYRK